MAANEKSPLSQLRCPRAKARTQSIPRKRGGRARFTCQPVKRRHPGSTAHRFALQGIPARFSPARTRESPPGFRQAGPSRRLDWASTPLPRGPRSSRAARAASPVVASICLPSETCLPSTNSHGRAGFTARRQKSRRKAGGRRTEGPKRRRRHGPDAIEHPAQAAFWPKIARMSHKTARSAKPKRGRAQKPCEKITD